MRLSVRQGAIPDDIMEQLGFGDYLKLFDFLIPNKKILEPLEVDEGLVHFKNLSDLKTRIEKNGCDILSLLEHSRSIPKIEKLMIFFQSKSLNQYHLYELGQYMESQKALFELEENFHVDSSFQQVLSKIGEILNKYTKNGYRQIIYTNKENDIREKIGELEDLLKDAVVELERRVFEETKFRMIYPYPKDLKADEDIGYLERSDLVGVEKNEEFIRIKILPNDRVKKILDEKRCLLKSLDKEMERKMLQINQSLFPYYEDLQNFIKKRDVRSFQYSLLGGVKKSSLVLPEFMEKSGIRLVKGRLYQLELLKKDGVVPLDIDLKGGGSVLSGANMSGKTTVLKTLYFILSLIKLGLPVPAKSVSLNYPRGVNLNLKSSGDIKDGTSGFSRELSFLTEKREKGAFVFCDELFMTTDPENGAKLSRIFLEELNNTGITLLVSSHYTEVTKIKGVSLFKMKDADIKSDKPDLKDLMENTPYKVEKLDDFEELASSDNKPLEIALHFPLTDKIREKIEREIKRGS